MTVDLKLALACAYASEAAYEFDPATRAAIMAPAGLVEVRYVEGRADARALICGSSATGTILAFQGTQFSRGELASILENLATEPVDLGGGRLVDAGYWDQTLALRAVLPDPANFAVVTGHSMGASIAHLYAGTESGVIGRVITFAGPKCASSGFWSSSEMPPSRRPERWVYGRDPAPDWPLVGYTQPGPMQWLHAGILTETMDRGEFVDDIADHWIANHIAALVALNKGTAA